MFNKIYEERFNDSFVRGYTSYQKITIMNLIKQLQDANIVINSVYVNEKADLGLKIFEGNYSLDKFLIKYNEIKKDIESIILNLENNCKLYVNNTNYIGLSSNDDIELNDLFSEKNKSL